MATGQEEMLTRSQSMVARLVAGETMIVPAQAKVGDLATIYTLNGTASWIWYLLESPRTLGQLVAAMVAEYEVETEQAEHDVKEFVGEMRAVGLVDVPASVAMAG